MLDFLKQLNQSPDGKFSHTKFWANIAYATATFVILYLLFKGQLTETYFVDYLAVVALHSSASKFIALKRPV